MKLKIEHDFKFEIGDIVKHITIKRTTYNSDRMVILTRGLEESSEGTNELYLVGSSSIGEVKRTHMYKDELKKV